MKRPDGYIDPRRVANIAAVLAALPATRQQIAERCGLHKDTVLTIVRQLHDPAKRVIRVGRWLPHPVHGPSIAVFALGKGADAVDDLPRLTTKQRSARYEASIKGTEKMDRRRARQKSRHWEKKAAAKPSHWTSALLGAAAREVRHA